MLKSYDRVKIYLDKFDKYYNEFVDSGIYDSITNFRAYVIKQLNISFGSKDTLFDIHDVSDCNTITTIKQKVKDIDIINHIPINDIDIYRFLYIIDKLNYNIYTLPIQDKCTLSYFSIHADNITSSKLSSLVKRSNAEVYYCVIKGKYRKYNTINNLAQENVRVLRIDNHDITELVNSKNHLPNTVAIYNLNYGNTQFLLKNSVYTEFGLIDNSPIDTDEIFDKSGYCIARQRFYLEQRLKKFVLNKFSNSTTADNINFLIDKYNLLIERAYKISLTKATNLLEQLYFIIEDMYKSLKYSSTFNIDELQVYSKYLEGIKLIHEINRYTSYTPLPHI